MSAARSQRGWLDLRLIVYPALVAVAVVVGYSVYVDWPRQNVTDASLVDAAGHERLVQMRASGALSPAPIPFAAPSPFVMPFQRTPIADVQRQASSGNTDAQCELAIRYEDGQGVLQDDNKARSLLTEAAARHNGCAVNGLGNLYARGAGVAVDPQTALSYYEAAAALGYPSAYFNLGRSYENGWGVQPDATQAFQWYLRAANAGSASAYDEVANRYAAGYGVSSNVSLAAQWYTLAAKAGDTHAMESLAKLYLADTAAADHAALALRWIRADKTPAGYYMLGLLYERGEAVRRDPRTAASWYRKAADLHNTSAARAYARMLEDGSAGGKADPEAAVRYLTAAARDGDAVAMDTLAGMALAGKGMPKNPPLADRLINAAAMLGDPDALLTLAKRFDTGSDGYPKDIVRAQALAMVAGSFGASPDDVVRIAPPRAPADPDKVLALMNQYRAAIQEARAEAAAASPGTSQSTH